VCQKLQQFRRSTILGTRLHKRGTQNTRRLQQISVTVLTLSFLSFVLVWVFGKFYRVCSLAHQRSYSSFIPALLAVIAMICSCAGTFYCQTVSFDMGNQLTTTNEERTLLWVGIFEYQDPQKPYSCLSYDNLVESHRGQQGGGDDNDGVGIEDPKWKAIKVISVISLLVGSVVTVASIVLPCRATTTRQNRCWWNVVGVVLLAVLAASQVVTIVLLQKSNICKFHRNPAVQFYNYNQLDGGNGTNDNNSNNDDDDQCHWAAGLVLLVVASVAFALAGIAVFLLPTPSSSWVFDEPRQTQTVTYERTVHPDGTMTVEKVQVVIGVVET
jgi:hypothetical protein